MSKQAINMGGILVDLKVLGVDEALEKLDLLKEKLEEVNNLISEISSSKVEISLIPYDDLKL
ncbi:hypothetical protein [uncultured Clostridium sp.]|uniref:hypothetical protein n=1 Tax=uncultured Clostridium sp. TaxID=59620 RepID=UPI002583B827|nr:hypothetical protein [uncultured Clostridium sp.]